MYKNEFLIEKYENLKIDIKMYMSEISESKVSGLKAQKIIILLTPCIIKSHTFKEGFVRCFIII